MVVSGPTDLRDELDSWCRPTQNLTQPKSNLAMVIDITHPTVCTAVGAFIRTCPDWVHILDGSQLDYCILPSLVFLPTVQGQRNLSGFP